MGNSIEPGMPGNPVRLTDPKMMRALAHPARIAIWSHIALRGSVTATECAEVAGLSPSACSYHLRTLAKYGFVERAEATNGKERPWRKVKQGLNWSPDELDGAAEEGQRLAAAARAPDQAVPRRRLAGSLRRAVQDHARVARGDAARELDGAVRAGGAAYTVSVDARQGIATGISAERCAHINLGYADPRSIDPQEWGSHSEDGVLVVPKAGERLYRLKSDNHFQSWLHPVISNRQEVAQVK